MKLSARLRREQELFFTALGFFTRIPVPAWVPWSPERLNHSARYFPLVGVLVGGIGAAVAIVALQLLPPLLAVLLSMAATLLLTGAFHEDGWADTCDGLGGGWEPAQVLEIMKDSRIGTYGTAGLVLMLLAKAAALTELAAHGSAALAAALIAAHALSRLASTSLIHTLDYVREDALSKAKPLARKLARGELILATLTGALPLLLLGLSAALAAAMLTALVTLYCARLLLRRLGGYTGDGLGATQQLSELAIYLAILATWNFT